MYLAVGTNGGEVSIWDAAKTSPIFRLKTHEQNRIIDMSWHNEIGLLFFVGTDGLIYFTTMLDIPNILTDQDIISILVHFINMIV